MDTVDKAMEFLKTLPKDARVSVNIGAEGAVSRHLRFPRATADVIAEDVWCRGDIGAMIEDAGKEPSDANIDAVLAAVPRGLDMFLDRLTEEGSEILHLTSPPRLKPGDSLRSPDSKGTSGLGRGG